MFGRRQVRARDAWPAIRGRPVDCGRDHFRRPAADFRGYHLSHPRSRGPPRRWFSSRGGGERILFLDQIKVRLAFDVGRRLSQIRRQSSNEARQVR